MVENTKVVTGETKGMVSKKHWIDVPKREEAEWGKGGLWRDNDWEFSRMNERNLCAVSWNPMTAKLYTERTFCVDTL